MYLPPDSWRVRLTASQARVNPPQTSSQSAGNRITQQIQRRSAVICLIWFLFLFGVNGVNVFVIFENSVSPGSVSTRRMRSMLSFQNALLKRSKDRTLI